MTIIPVSESDRKRLAMHVIVILFGIGAWVAINGVWVELPILVDKLPESWGLPSFLVILMQAANIGPLVVALMQAFLSKYYYQNVLIYVMLASGTLSCFFLIFFWDHTAYFGGAEHSIALFVLFLVLGFVDCTSSLTFMPFITRFQSVFLTSYFIGEGLSGFLPSIFALIQGVSEAYCKNVTVVNTTTNETHIKIVTAYHDPRFSVEVFFGFLCFMMALCSSAFIMLNHTKTAKLFIQRKYEPQPIDVAKSTSTELSSLGSTGHYTEGLVDVNHSDEAEEENPQNPIKKPLIFKQYVYFYVLIFWMSCIANGAMPSVISYSSLPYGQLPYHFAATLGAMANPVACFIALFVPVKSHMLVGVFTAVTTAFAAFLMFLAVESPCPVLVHSAGGATLMVFSQILFVFTTSYAKVSIGQILRERGSEKALVWYGAFTQLGALVGACVMFPLVNVYQFFTPGDECTTVCPT